MHVNPDFFDRNLPLEYRAHNLIRVAVIHAGALPQTADVGVCQTLARASPARAANNAENIVFYIMDYEDLAPSPADPNDPDYHP